MISFSDVFKKSFLEGFAGTEIGIKTTVIALSIASLLALYLFVLYRVLSRKAFYSKSFNISLAGITLITTAVILTIQSSIVVSLGMVGALSIVRFRTAVKEPMDLMFLFWAITNGIICGVGLANIAVLLSLFLTVGIMLLDRLPVVKAPQVLVVNAGDCTIEEAVMQTVGKYAKYSKIKSRSMTADTLNLVIELRTDAGSDLLQQIMELDQVSSASMLAQDGEVTF